jgi:hypothetical protein
MVGTVASAAVLTLACSGPEPSTDPEYGKKTMKELDESSDGRYHRCGLVTEEGVTEYVQVYIERCNKD